MVVTSATSIPPSSSSTVPGASVASASVNGNKSHLTDDKPNATATVDQTILDTTQEENDLIGREFVRQYFTILGTKPEAFHRFYNNDSQLIVNGSVYTGTTSIKSYVLSLNLHDCHTRIYQITVTKPEAHSILVQILGEMSINRGALRRFAQNVILSSFVKRKLYVAYDNFQYIDQAFSQICVSYGVEASEAYSENVCDENHSKVSEDVRYVDESTEKPKVTSNPVVATSSSTMDAKAPPFIPSAQLSVSDQSQLQNQVICSSNDEEICESVTSELKPGDGSCSYSQTPKISPRLASDSMMSQQEFCTDELKMQSVGFNSLSYAGVAANSRMAAAASASLTTPMAMPFTAINLQAQPTLVGVTPHGAPYLSQHNNQIPHMAYIPEVKALELHDVNGIPIVNSNSQMPTTNNGPCTTAMYVSSSEMYPPGMINSQRRTQSTMSYNNQKYNERFRQYPFPNCRNASPRPADLADLESQIYVRNVPRQDMYKELTDHFSKFGNVSDVAIVAKDSVQNNNFFAFVTYENIISAKKALSCKEHLLDGNYRLDIEQRKHRSRFGYNYGGAGMMGNGHRMPQHGQNFGIGNGGKNNQRNFNTSRFNAPVSSTPHTGGLTGR